MAALQLMNESSGQVNAFSDTRNINQLTHKVALFHSLNASLAHCFHKHVSVRLAHKLCSAVIAKGDALKELVNAKQGDDAFAMVDIGIGEKPQADFVRVDVLEQLLELWVGLDDSLQGQGVVDLAVVLERVDLVVADEAFNGEAVLLVVLVVQLVGFLLSERQMGLEVLVWGGKGYERTEDGLRGFYSDPNLPIKCDIISATRVLLG